MSWSPSQYGLRPVIRWAGVVCISILIVLSIVGAFLGPERARSLFNSVPVIGYWSITGLVLVVGCVHRCLHKDWPGFVAHLGGLMVLGGGMWGSVLGHRIRGLIVQGPSTVQRGSSI